MSKDEDAINEEMEKRVQRFARKTLTGDIRDLILQELRSPIKKPWEKLSESEQRDIIYRVAHVAESIVQRTVVLVASGGRRSIQAKLKSVTVKDGIEAKLEMSQFDAQRHELMDATGSTVVVAFSDASEFRGERAPARPSKDEPALFEDDEATTTAAPPSKRGRKGNGTEATA